MRRRDMLVALLAAGMTAGAFALAGELPRLHSTVVDWSAMTAKPTEAGSVRAVLKGPTATLDELEVHVTTLAPGKAPHPPHKHPNEELLIVKQGTIEALVGGEWKRAGAGATIFFASNELHGVRNAGADEAVYHVVAWKTPATPAQ
ncbi:MAG: cupin domain-containing protein [Terracidiphilus sp.]